MSVRFQKGSCVELKDSKENVVLITEDNEDLGHSYKDGFAKKCETYNHSLSCPEGSFAKEIEWDTKFELTKGIKLSCYKPEFYQNNAFIMESHPGSEIIESDKRKCAAIYGITFKKHNSKDAVTGLDLKKNCTVGYGPGIRSFCILETALSGIDFVIERGSKYL